MRLGRGAGLSVPVPSGDVSAGLAVCTVAAVQAVLAPCALDKDCGAGQFCRGARCRALYDAWRAQAACPGDESDDDAAGGSGAEVGAAAADSTDRLVSMISQGGDDAGGQTSNDLKNGLGL